MTIRPAYSMWSAYQEALRDHVTALTEDQLAIRPSPERWPIWETVGHLACQRVFWLCDFAGEPGKDDTPFPNAAFNCPGDDDLEHILGSAALVDALVSTFRVVERCLDSWTFDVLEEELRAAWDDGMVYRRGEVIQRVFTHDVWHSAEVNETLAEMGMPFDLWD